MPYQYCASDRGPTDAIKALNCHQSLRPKVCKFSYDFYPSVFLLSYPPPQASEKVKMSCRSIDYMEENVHLPESLVALMQCSSTEKNKKLSYR